GVTATSIDGNGTTSVVDGATVFDTATVTPSGPGTPTGKVTYNFYNTDTPVYGFTAPVWSYTVDLSGGLVPDSKSTAPLTPGDYSFIAVYSGDGTFAGTVSSVEPLTVNPQTSSPTGITTQATPTNTTVGTALSDTATLSTVNNIGAPTG